MSLTSFGAQFVEGKDYVVLSIATGVVEDRQQGSVLEFFSFGCPWCYRLEPALSRWAKNHEANIHFQKVPVVFNKDWEYYARAFYVAEALSLNSKLDPALFQAILKDKRSLASNQAMISFFIEKGVDPALVKSAFEHSTSIDMAVKEGQALMASDHITAVPALVVNHRFKTDLQMAKTEERLLLILDFLLENSHYASEIPGFSRLKIPVLKS
ncbi:MAG: thiol:disulfide interchange protein DsbA/DsbL [Legionellales bacterium]|nr:thiol:disulfide interchange protein DsbA/DsbL [Legionellales bacterium]